MNKLGFLQMTFGIIVCKLWKRLKNPEFHWKADSEVFMRMRSGEISSRSRTRSKALQFSFLKFELSDIRFPRFILFHFCLILSLLTWNQGFRQATWKLCKMDRSSVFSQALSSHHTLQTNAYPRSKPWPRWPSQRKPPCQESGSIHCRFRCGIWRQCQTQPSLLCGAYGTLSTGIHCQTASVGSPW